VRLTVQALIVALVAASGCLTTVPGATADATPIAWKTCGGSTDLACGHLNVSLDPSGTTAGTITLALRRHRSPVGESSDAVIALAGGPGQSAIPFTSQFVEVLGPIAATRDVIAFDQRGTGFSHPLSCPAFEHLTGAALPIAIAICAGQIGPTRGLYTTADTVADIEAIRQAGGYQKLVLYGTSYGTKVAERYAQEYPSHVEALILDSVVPPSGPEPFDKTTFAAVGRVLRQLCSAHACSQTTHDPVGDLARLVKRMGNGQLHGRVVDDKGISHRDSISSNDLVGILLEGDLDPILRSEFPAAVRAADDGEDAPLARLVRRAEGEGGEGEPEALSEGFDWPLYFSTICDETSFPWSQAASSRTRLHEAIAALLAQPARTFAPFTAVNALELSDAPACASWPLTPGGPETLQAPLPNVPTLILSGADDLRTPTANAREVAREIPDASLLVVPNTGHSVLSSDPTSCSEKALQALFAGKPVRKCSDSTPPGLLLPTPLPPRKLSSLRPVGAKGLAGRTVDGTLMTLSDFTRQIVLELVEKSSIEGLLGGGSSVRTGGLLAGWGGMSRGSQVLHGYSYVPGLTVSGKVTAGVAKLRIGGRAALHGTLTIGSGGGLSGVLDGKHVHLGSLAAIRIEHGGGALALSLARNQSRLRALQARGADAVLRHVLAGDG
jgi:pimeloyl-ACP methyl ester carboxylesterase